MMQTQPAPAPSPAPQQAQRLLFLLAGVFLVVLAGALVVAHRQAPRSGPWEDDPPRWSAPWFTEPIEFHRWMRPGLQAPRLRSLALVAPREGEQPALFAGGEQGVLLRSTDAGRSWSARRIPGGQRVVSVAVGAAGAWVALDSGGNVWRSEDAGRSWSASLPAASGLRALAYAPDGQVLVGAGERGVLRSEDHGRSWRSVAGDAPGPKEVVVPQRSTAKTGDVGNWNAAPPSLKAPLPPRIVPPQSQMPPQSQIPAAAQGPAPATPANLRALVFTGADTAVAATQDALWHSTDGGRTWNEAAKPATWRVAFRSLVRQGTTVLALADTALLRSGDGGATWTRVLDERMPLRAVALAPGGAAGLALRDDGTLLRTQDGGASWTALRPRAMAGLQSLVLADAGAAVGIDAGGGVMRAENVDEAWTSAMRYTRYPAPWFIGFVGFATLVPAGIGLAGWRRRSREKRTRQGLLDNGVSDQPISRARDDRLAFAPVVEALASFLRHSATTPPLAIAINAPWGMGKTSFMAMLLGRLRELGARPVWFNVWHHQHEDVLLAPLLQAIMRQAIPSWWRWQGWRFRARLVARRFLKLFTKRVDVGMVMGLLGLLAIPVYVASLVARAQPGPAGAVHFATLDRLLRDAHDVWNFLLGGDWLASARDIGLADVLAAAFAALRSDLASGYRFAGIVLLAVCVYMLWTCLLRPFPSSPAILLASWGNKFNLSQAEAMADFRQRFRDHFGDVANALAPRTLTVFIDDLDRCEPAKAAELLEAVNYLCESGPCYVVLGMARELVEAQVASAHAALAEEQALLERARGARLPEPCPRPEQDRLAFARKYLRKLVQLDVQLPSMDAEQALLLLLQRPAPTREEEAQERWQAWRKRIAGAFLPATLGLILLLFAAALGWQARQTYLAMDQAEKAAQVRREATLREVQGFVRDAREFEQSLRLQAEAARASNAAPEDIAALRADAEVAAREVKAVEAALPALQKGAGEGRGHGFDQVVAGAVAPSQALLQELQARHGWSRARVSAGEPAARAGSDAGKAAVPEGWQGAATDSAVLAGDEPMWPYALAFLPVLLLVGAALVYRDHYVLEPTREYEAAVATWQKQLLGRPDTGSPRELKRFMNVSRYVVARAQAADPLRPALSESAIVELSARWLLARADPQGGGVSVDKLAGEGGRSPERQREAAWFLKVVGDISG